MNSESILYIIIGIVTFDFFFNQALDLINLKARKRNLTEEAKEFYDEETYARSQEYQSVRSKFSFLSSSISFIASILILALGGFGYLDSLLRPMIESELVLSLAYFGVLYILADLFSLPFSLYSTFVIEERFGFNKTTLKTFVLDKVKGYVLAAIIGGLLLSALIFLIQTLGNSFWIYFWVIAAVFILFTNLFYTSLILPLFNKLTPLEDGELKDRIIQYANSVNFPLDNIYVIDGSKRSSKANAFFSGLGKTKKIVLYDTLINNHTIDELVAVLAHEVGHFKKKHIVFGLFISIGQIGLMLFIMSLLIFDKETSLALGGSQWAIHLNLLAFGILYSPISTVLGILGNMLSRKNEFEADDYAKSTFDSLSLQKALKKLSVDNLSNLYPHPAYVFVHYSHPPLLTRLANLRK
ncbi:M48 family metallopeptidase [Fulvivirga lutea]|uniref:M48 family metallopeptidase n=1 Tax=Fulvivirga lutea TaxID=2810512 RepID=A0A974WE11_9BACT|nr:M48 family metallopeptidase [Fulvivirga lutea]QSE96000.1 M48 family metallopeptidase [Fulvivirga lutea]